jgi:hypothetical protein
MRVLQASKQACFIKPTNNFIKIKMIQATTKQALSHSHLRARELILYHRANAC